MLNLNIYPIEIPKIQFKDDLDFLIMELPPRYMPMMPNGLGHLENILKTIDINYQVFDANIILYHQYHSNRILNNLETIVTPTGFEFPIDPWATEYVDFWDVKEELQEYFAPFIDKIILEMVKAKPKIVGFSVNGNNLKFTQTIIKNIKKMLPETTILVGGYICVFQDIGTKVLEGYDYMVVGEAELTLGKLLLELLQGKRPFNSAGIISQYDTPDWEFEPAPLLHDLDSIDFPRYEWIDYNLYKSYLGTNLIPIAGSRGCIWSRCTFCSEKFFWRRRGALQIADEFEWHSKKGGYIFHFNESDLNGDPDSLIALCQEVIKRGLHIKFIGQLRIHKRSDKAFFDILKSAGFDSLRFGVDAWSKNTLKMQKKGYPLSLINQNLKACHEAGITVGVNIVLGIPGETEEDIDETIETIKQNKAYINKVENVNLLILAYGNNFYENPEKHHIKFKGDKEDIYKKYPRSIPSELWYWEKDGVIVDHDVRIKRLEKLTIALENMHLYMMPFTKKNVNQKLNKTTELPTKKSIFKKYSIKEILSKPLVIYGLGELGKRVLEVIPNDSEVYFTDSNRKKWGTTVYSKKVISNEEILNYSTQVLIASVAFESDIRKILSKLYSNNLTIYALSEVF